MVKLRYVVWLGGLLVACSGSDGGTQASECDWCPPCGAGERRYECNLICVCDTVENVRRDEQDRLLACGWEQPCETALFGYNANAGAPIYSAHQAECLFTALRDRARGRFDSSYDAATGFVLNEHSDYTFLLDGSETPLVLRTSYDGAQGPWNALRDFHVERCTLAAPEVFDQCLADPESCTQARDWLGSCLETTDATAQCPP